MDSKPSLNIDSCSERQGDDVMIKREIKSEDVDECKYSIQNDNVTVKQEMEIKSENVAYFSDNEAIIKQERTLTINQAKT